MLIYLMTWYTVNIIVRDRYGILEVKMEQKNFILPTSKNREDVLSFYQEFENNHENCIGYGNYRDFDNWLA